MSLAELLEPVAALAITLAGAFAEVTASQWVLGGETVVGLWLAYMGAIALYAGLFVVDGGLLPDAPDATAE